jgi:hypothetical protein
VQDGDLMLFGRKKNAMKAGIGEKGSIFAPRFYGKEPIKKTQK